MRSSLRRMVAALAATCVAAIVAVLGVGATAFADPAGPTDYRSEITSIEPATPTIEVEVLGGDSFVQLKVDPGTEVTVIGYRGEEYLWFQPDGSVLENQNSPSTYVNADRYLDTLPPPNASAEAVAEVASKLGLLPTIAYVNGDDLLPRVAELEAAGSLQPFGKPGSANGDLGDLSNYVSANAYLGCFGIVEALERGAVLDQHAGVEQPPGGDHLHHRHGEAEGAGAGDDQYRHRDAGRAV